MKYHFHYTTNENIHNCLGWACHLFIYAISGATHWKSIHIFKSVYYENSVRTAFPLSTPQKSMGTRFPRVPTPQHHWVCLTYQYKKLKYLRLFSCIHLMGWASPQNLLLNEKRRILPLARSYFPSCTSMCGFYQLKFDTNRIF